MQTKGGKHVAFLPSPTYFRCAVSVDDKCFMPFFLCILELCVIKVVTPGQLKIFSKKHQKQPCGVQRFVFKTSLGKCCGFERKKRKTWTHGSFALNVDWWSRRIPSADLGGEKVCYLISVVSLHCGIAWYSNCCIGLTVEGGGGLINLSPPEPSLVLKANTMF